jgi:hypothetical protein
MWRWLLTSVLIVFSLLLWYMTLTVPMVSATAPAILAIMFSGITYLTWPTRRRKKKPEMVDPEWTPERGYSHAKNLMK